MSDNGNIKANTSFASNRFQHPSPGVGAVGQYQLSGIPYATASVPVNEGGEHPTQVDFPYVTKFVTVQNLATGSNKPLRVGFIILDIIFFSSSLLINLDGE